MLDVSVVVVTYNSQRFMDSCLGAIPAATHGVSSEIIIVDNDSTDNTLQAIAVHAPDARVVRNDANCGFAVASNQGIRAAHGRYVLLLNPDAIAAPGSIASLVTYMDAHPNAGIAGPRLHDPDGSLQFSVRNFPTPANQWFESLYLHRMAPALTALFGEVVYDPRAYEASRSVEWVSGASMMLRPEAIAQSGLLDEQFFMYSEEKDLCYRVTRAGWTIDYAADADMVHGHDGRQSPEAFARQLRSKLMYFRKHFGPVGRFGCVSGLSAGIAIRATLGACAALVGGKRREKLLIPARGVLCYWRARRASDG